MRHLFHYVGTVVVVVLLMLASVYVWTQDRRHKRERLRENTRRFAEHVRLRMDTTVASRVETIRELAASFRSNPGWLEDESQCGAIGAVLSRLAPELERVDLLDEQGRAGRPVFTSMQRRSREAHAGVPLTSAQGVAGSLAFVVPYRGADLFRGLRAELSLSAVLESAVSASRGEVAVALTDRRDGTLVHVLEEHGRQDERSARWTVSLPLNLAGQQYTLAVTPGAAAMESVSCQADMVVLVVGVIVTLGVAIIINRELQLRIAQREIYESNLRELSVHTLERHEAERQEIGGKLHDKLGHQLSLARLEIESAAAPLSGEAADRLNRAAERVGSAVATVRSMTASLRPPVLGELGLGVAARHLVEEFREATGAEATFEQDGADTRLDEHGRLCLYRVLQECLTNITRHAGARVVHVALRGMGKRIQLSVRDDGRGFDAANPAQFGGVGLLGMRERVEKAGGRFTVVSAVGGGTTVTAGLPARGRPVSVRDA